MPDSPSIQRALGILLLICLPLACASPPPAWHQARNVWEEHSQPASDAPPLTEPHPGSELAELLAWAEQHSPAVLAAAERWRAALERVPQVGDLPDPQLTFGYFLEEVQTRSGPMQWRVGLSQPLPWFGELDLRDQAAMAGAHAAGARFATARLTVAAAVQDAWAELAWVDAAVAVTTEHRSLLDHWEQVARTRYAAGIGGEADVIRAQVELGTLDDRVRTLQDLRRPVAARLNAALDREPGAALPVPQLDALPDLVLDDERLAAELPHSAPTLLALEFAIEAAEAGVALAETGAWPRAAVGVDYTHIGKGGDDAVALTAGLSLPLRRGRIDAAVAQAQAELSGARAERRQAGNQLAAELQLQLYRLRDAERRVALYRDTLLPKGAEAVSAVSASYQAGEIGFLDMVDAERVLLEFQLAVARAQADRAQALARVSTLTGTALLPEIGS